MTQLIIHEYSEEQDRAVPAYAVCLTARAAFAEPLEPQWAATARRVERSLNAQYFGNSAPDRAAMAVRPDGRGNEPEFPEQHPPHR